ncbi:hypothetical protein KQX54_004543 [Cotesia glomerata]|uniref:Uncharacterized protein n=1 Tax=Cotesia glomerata TaxID=32391 RepID=A0AAV7IPY2_COTGL|nr:hypothetical protein KQX54_004543 [Cotesia glomerata]
MNIDLALNPTDHQYPKTDPKALPVNWIALEFPNSLTGLWYTLSFTYYRFLPYSTNCHKIYLTLSSVQQPNNTMDIAVKIKLLKLSAWMSLN